MRYYNPISGLALSDADHLARRQAGKHIIDIAIAAVGLMCIIPLLLLIAAAIKFDSAGPVFYRQVRIGRFGRPFTCFKFRSMVVNADVLLGQYLRANESALLEWSQKQKLGSDPRVTRVGDFLRRSSLDELPQLINVLLGQMSLVGPRPIVESEMTKYGDAIGCYLSVKPGITGLWQISGRSDCSYDERVALDTAYVTDWSLSNDFIILVKTIPVVLQQHGSC
ncbi:sugar transferase [Microvirga sp. 2YAF29]|uniref:sugar transferase n=1 Tax=Microvirga sp. 2YAF29 TaxID=3233031 RepID=UPI003F958217